MACIYCGFEPCVCLRQYAMQVQMVQQQAALNAYGLGLAQHPLAQLGSLQQRYESLSPPEPLENAGIKVEDLIGWRIWMLTPSGMLQSFSAGNLWKPGVPMEGNPGDHNSAGVWAFKDEAAAAAKLNQCTRHVMGRVRLWGHVVEHSLGYRAQFARIVSLDAVHLVGRFPWEWRNRSALKWLRHRYGLKPDAQR